MKLTRRMKMAVVSSKTPWHQSAVVGATAHSPFVPTLRLDSKEPIGTLDAELNGFHPEVLVGYASMIRSTTPCTLVPERIAAQPCGCR